MKHRLSTTLILMSLLAFEAVAGGRKTTTPATLSASCQTCSTTENITYSGSGYKAGSTVIVDIQGPVSYSIQTTADGSGNIYIDYGSVLTYPVGSYTASAQVQSGRSYTTVASDTFDVQ